MLTRDLQILNDGDWAAISLKMCQDLPALNDFAEALGCIYVFEGATLGGQFIAGHLRRNFGLTPENGAAFFNSSGERVGQMWESFGATATATVLEMDEKIVGAARETFTKFKKWFSRKNPA